MIGNPADNQTTNMTRLLLCTATILALTASASAQGFFGGSMVAWGVTTV
jgi:hypothetical protein